MQTQILFQDAAQQATPLLVVFAADANDTKNDLPEPFLLTASDAVRQAAGSFLLTGEFKAAAGETLLLHAPTGLACERLLVVGTGKAKTLATQQIRHAAGTAVRTAKAKSIRTLAVVYPDPESVASAAAEELPSVLTARALVEGAHIADFDPATYRSDRKDQSIELFTVLAYAANEQTEWELRGGVEEGAILGSSVNFTQSLVNEPGNVLTPTELGKRTKEMCDAYGLQCDVYSTDKLKELGMGAFLGVTQGSVQPPALIVMRYEPEVAPAADAPVLGLVGKGITFDTGGISLKPADGMEKMKYDMAGAAAMIGAMRAIAQLKPKSRVLSVVCSTENMPGGAAYKPGDVLTAMSGKTIEIVNTDAEGRLVLADGLHYAKQLGATHLINAATLTGACVVALGTSNSGVFSNDDDTCEAFLAGVRRSGESFWRLPCTDEYREFIKSSIADIRNTGATRWGGAITAAMFLKEFVGDTPWIHLDIAGQAWVEEKRSYIAQGPSGVAVRSIVEWVRALSPID